MSNGWDKEVQASRDDSEGANADLDGELTASSASDDAYRMLEPASDPSAALMSMDAPGTPPQRKRRSNMMSNGWHISGKKGAKKGKRKAAAKKSGRKAAAKKSGRNKTAKKRR